MFKKLYLLALVTMFCFTQSYAGAWYVQDSNPWGETFNISAMSNVFGAGNWQQSTYAAAAPATIFDASTTFVMLEGSDLNANALSAFLTANAATIENWVSAGGHLFINAAPNQGGNINFGFGSTVLTYPVFSSTGTAVDPSNPIFQGPYTPVATTYTGGSLAHGLVSGTGLTNLMYGNDSMSIVLAMKNWGTGTVYFGGLSQPNWWAPQPQAEDLWYNIFSNIANYVPVVGPCNPADSLTVSNITVDGATFNWTGTATTYSYVVDASPLDPGVPGTNVPADSVVINGLQHDSTYYFHVRAVCDSSNSSAWTTISFTTAHLNLCAAPTGYATVSFTQVSPYATLHWSAPDAAQYFWLLDNTASDPAVNGNATNATTLSFANLASNATYYFHVRCICTTGDTSSWTTIQFITASCPFATASATVNETPVGPYAAVSWMAPTAATYYWVLDHDSTAPAVMGNMTTNTSMTFASLWTGTDYYFHVRCICTNGDTSTWTTIMFHTPGPTPTNVSNVGNDGTTVVCSPNPTTDKITISITGAVYENASVSLSGLDGRMISTAPVIGNTAVIDLSGLPAALYFIKYTNKDYSNIIKVMKQ